MPSPSGSVARPRCGMVVPNDIVSVAGQFRIRPDTGASKVFARPNSKHLWQLELSSISALLEYVGDLRGESHEKLVTFYTDGSCRVVSVDVVAGTYHNVDINPGRIVHQAQTLSACGILMVHNHPSGTSRMSPADLRATRIVASVAEACNLTLIDHVVVATDGYWSAREHGYL